MVDELIKQLVVLIDCGFPVGMPALLRTSNKILDKGWLSTENQKILATALPDIFDAKSYLNVDGLYFDETVAISLIRSECVRFAKNLLEKSTVDDNNVKNELQKLLDKAKRDSLPEVRFADQLEVY